MSNQLQGGPKAPKDPTKKRKGFFIMRNKSVAGSPMPDGTGTQFIYLDCGRMITAAGMVGNIKDKNILDLLTTVEGFRKLVHSIGVTVECENKEETVEFHFQMYGKTDPYKSGTTLKLPVKADGMEQILHLEECEWSEDDNIPGQARFVFEKAGTLATVAVKFYLHEGFEVPEIEEENPVDFTSPYYPEMLSKAIMQTGNNFRLKKAIEKARRGEDVTIAFIGGSITQGAGAVPINTECYAYKTYKAFCDVVGKTTEENVHYIKAGVGGTPSEFGMLRYERDVLSEGTVEPDVVVVEFAVNDEGDETKGECYDSLVRKILNNPNKPAVILLFAVFANDWNLQERLGPVGVAYDLPMVSTRNTVVEQFYKKPGEGRVVSKNQFFYDVFHPTSIGHTIMADGIKHLLEVVDKQEQASEDVDISKINPPLGGEFENVKLLDGKAVYEGAKIDCGDFKEKDAELQAVERNMDLTHTPQLPYNWMYQGAKAEEDAKPFAMNITCTALLLIAKDSASVAVGCADVYVDGEKVLTYDPHQVGWTHCNPVIVFRGKERRSYHVEVRMCEGDENKDFTILGFGYVE
ncbi:MAG: SGNH/GDSL hydrolase family protein [Lachnospiraceae bacterium]|nr:SGNH/GDSL hydrolase family protein [Lachnospiraceae bacterium]